MIDRKILQYVPDRALRDPVSVHLDRIGIIHRSDRLFNRASEISVFIQVKIQSIQYPLQFRRVLSGCTDRRNGHYLIAIVIYFPTICCTTPVQLLHRGMCILCGRAIQRIEIRLSPAIAVPARLELRGDRNDPCRFQSIQRLACRVLTDPACSCDRTHRGKACTLPVRTARQIRQDQLCLGRDIRFEQIGGHIKGRALRHVTPPSDPSSSPGTGPSGSGSAYRPAG